MGDNLVGGARGGEVALYQILVGSGLGVLLGGAEASTPGDALDAGLPQEPGHPLLVHVDAEGYKNPESPP